MCWWNRKNVEDGTDAQEALLPSEKTEQMTKSKDKKQSIKEQQYEDVLNKYRKSSDQQVSSQVTNENAAPQVQSGADPTPADTPLKQVSRSSSEPTQSNAKKSKKSSLKGSQSAPTSKNVNSEADSGIQKVQAGLSEREDLLQQVTETTEKLQENTRHMRSLSKRLKDKQSQKLKKSLVPW